MEDNLITPCPGFPILEYDEDHSMIMPNTQNELLRDLGGVDTCVMTFFPGLRAHETSERFDELYRFFSGGAQLMQYVYNDSLVVANLPGGAAPAAALMEELISIGVSRFVCIGSAGLISKEFDQNKMLVVTEAIRDEGTSYHYLPAGEAAYTSPLLREQLKDSLARQGVDFAEGKVWTTDAFYRETPSRVARRLAEGAIAVEMECAALCAVAQRRGVEFAQALFFSDSLLSEVWSGFSRDYPEKRLKALDLLLETGLELAGLL